MKVMEPYLQRFASGSKMPILFTSSAEVPEANHEIFRRIGLHLLPLAAGTQAVKAVAEYSGFLRGREPDAIKPPPVHAASAGDRDVRARNGQLALLRAHGATLPQERLVHDESQACAAARAIGFPVVLKIESPDVAHKTEAGGVKLGLESEAAVAEAFRAILDNVKTRMPGAKIDGVLVQQTAARGRELILGVTQDDTFGPLLMAGFGGIHAEVLKDVVLSPLPVDRRTALDMLARLRGAEILRGVRGEAPADLDSVAGLMAGVSQLVANHPEVQQLDLNPVIVYPKGRGHCVVDTLFVLKQQT
jgi:acetyltransferase